MQLCAGPAGSGCGVDGAEACGEGRGWKGGHNVRDVELKVSDWEV